jgi:CheY-like chemotaxis protein
MEKLKKILLVDDDTINNHINEALLKDLGIAEAITVKTNGESALDHLLFHCEVKLEASICPELVIFDHHMPVMDGMEMMQALNERGFLNEQRIVYMLLGVNSTAQNIEEFTKLGVQEYTTKPLSEQTVMDTYNKYFANDTNGDYTS